MKIFSAKKFSKRLDQTETDKRKILLYLNREDPKKDKKGECLSWRKSFNNVVFGNYFRRRDMFTNVFRARLYFKDINSIEIIEEKTLAIFNINNVKDKFLEILLNKKILLSA